MNAENKIIISSDIDYDDLCAEIYYKDQFVAIIDQEKGIDKLQIEIHPPPNQAYWSFSFFDFEQILEEAKEALWEMRKIE